ncbi:MAG: hypothetical protein K0Q74_555 [Gammaproteobacteria bacterium]|jgi:N-acetyl-anhydromuramyl-L-alanine amidase AmpD|nr:hypothetical protein [Gammaproteobacteria bacterium]
MEVPNIIQKPICFNSIRIDLTRRYMLDHYGMASSDININPSMIVLHWTNIPTLEASFDCLYPPLLSNRPELESQVMALNVSAHFLVDRDGSIYQLMPINWMGRHVIGLNHAAIGVENVAEAGFMEKHACSLTDKQVDANIALVRYVCEKLKTITYLIGHHEYHLFRGSHLWLEKNPHYFTEKQDPGDAFMEAVRMKTKDLSLARLPLPK